MALIILAAVIIVVALVEPGSSNNTKSQEDEVEWSGGQRLGSLINALDQAYADKGTKDRITIKPGDHDKVMNFNPQLGKIRGKTWIEIFQKICDLRSCLKCEVLSGSPTITLSIAGGLSKLDDGTQICADAETASVEDFAYNVRLLGKTEIVQGTSIKLDIGKIAANERHEITLSITAEVSPKNFRISSIEPPVEVIWASNKPEETISKTDLAQLKVVLVTPASNEEQLRVVTIKPTVSDNIPPLTLKVHYHPIQGTQTVKASSGDKSSGRGQDYSDMYSICARAPAEGDYIVDSSKEWLTGDRNCGSYAKCKTRIADDRKSVCLDFSLQGHDECLKPFSNCDPKRDSKGHVEAIFKLKESQPILQLVSS